ncbi:MAG: hypothetical protein MK135_16060, partial [Polyangiaceae bacterium]|nr:hypothetical protein [Polyangiaceae bacterium]
LLTTVLKAPSGKEILTGRYPQTELSSGSSEVWKEPQAGPPAQGSVSVDVGKASSFLRFQSGGRTLPDGGYVQLKEFDGQLLGRVEGEFHLGGAGSSKGAMKVKGPFRLRLCNVSLDGTRKKDKDGAKQKGRSGK